MPIATLTSKGQVTIPKAVRESLCLRTGDRIEFVLEAGGQAIVKPVTKTVAEVFGKLRRRGQKRLSVEAMDEAMAREMKRRQR